MLGTSADPGSSGRARKSSKEHWLVGSNARHNVRRTHSPEEFLPEYAGPRRCGNPRRVAASVGWAKALQADKAEQKPIDTLRRRFVQRFIVERVKRVSGGGAKSRPRLLPEDPRRVKPMGGASSRRVKPSSDCQGLLEGSKPRNRGSSGRPGTSVAGIPLGETVGGCFRV